MGHAVEYVGSLPPCQWETSNWKHPPLCGKNPYMEDLKHGLMLQRIQEGLDKIGMKPKPAAIKMGLSETAILDILKGRSKNPKRNTLQTLADAFGMSVEYLTGNANYDSAPTDEVYNKLRMLSEEQQSAFKAMIDSMIKTDKGK